MQDSVASRTALRVAIRRAEHQVIDVPPVFQDPLSLRIIGAEERAKIVPGVVSRQQRLNLSFRAFMAVRSRFAEDELAAAVARGVRQYVVLGAGLDTFAYRNPFAATGLLVYEVDHPATQAWKREQLQAAQIAIPDTAVHVAANFERQTLSEALGAANFQFDRPAFFSWLGVIQYLTDRAFEDTMRFVASMPSGSGIVIDYAVRRSLLNDKERIALDALSASVARMGEPFRLFFDPGELAERLFSMGFRELDDLGREQMNARYCADRTDGLKVKGNLGRLLRAEIY